MRLPSLRVEREKIYTMRERFVRHTGARAESAVPSGTSGVHGPPAAGRCSIWNVAASSGGAVSPSGQTASPPATAGRQFTANPSSGRGSGRATGMGRAGSARARWRLSAVTESGRRGRGESRGTRPAAASPRPERRRSSVARAHREQGSAPLQTELTGRGGEHEPRARSGRDGIDGRAERDAARSGGVNEVVAVLELEDDEPAGAGNSMTATSPSSRSLDPERPEERVAGRESDAAAADLDAVDDLDGDGDDGRRVGQLDANSSR